jgi:adenylyl-sulfate kinase
MKPIVVWITGLSGAGKTTLAKSLQNLLKDNHRVGLIDGDDIRARHDKPKGFDMKSRESVVYEAIYMAKNMLTFQKANVIIVAMISPLQSMRNEARKILTTYSDVRFIEVYLDVPLDICEHRDPKGLYAKARAGEITNFTGIDSIYEPAINAEIHIPFNYSVELSTQMIYHAIYEENTTTD